VRSLTTPAIAMLVTAIMLGGCTEPSPASSPSPGQTVAGKKSAPSAPADEETPSAEELSVPFDSVPGAPRVVDVRWGESLAAAEGFTDQPAMLGVTPARRNEATQCVTDFVEVLPDLSSGDDARGASDDGLSWISDELSPGQSDGLDDYIVDSWIPRSGGGRVDVRVAVVAWEDGANAVIGSRAFPEIDVALLFVITCPATASSRDEVRARAADGHLDVDVATRTD
jgi:hypothetical protein